MTFLSNYELDSTQWLHWLAGIAVLVLVPLLLKSYLRSRTLPPGPRGLPIFGNIFQVPAQMPWFKFTEWAQEFGPIFSLNMAGQTFIILNTFKAASDLLDRQSSIYSDRPRLVMADEVLAGGMALPFAHYDTTVRKMRRAAHEGLSVRAVEKYKPVQAREAASTAIQLLQTPHNWYRHLKRAAASSILTVLYGWPSIGEKDELLVERIAAVVIRAVESIVPGSYLVNIFPALKHAPLWMAKWKREGLEWHRRDTEMFIGFNKEVEEKMHSGTSSHCFVSELHETRDRHELSEKEAAWLSGVMISAASESTSATLNYFMLAMVLYPLVMHKAQAELDAVVGRERIPTFEDQKNLPYIEAIVKEVLRWRPAGPMAVPRNVAEDNWYLGYYIPRGATVIPNVWAMHRDPTIFPDFDDFRPDRVFEKTPEDTHFMGHTAYGFGRRICVGLNLANQMLFINIATILWALNIDKMNDSDGNPVTPSRHDFIDTGIVVSPSPFKCRISPRFQGARLVLEREMPEAALVI